MNRLIASAAPLALVFTAVPAQAQSPEDDAAMAEVLGGLSEMFPVEPLTAEEQARLPAATAIVEQIMPPGSLGEVMGPMYSDMLGPIMAMEAGDAVTAIRTVLGEELLVITPERAAQALAILDPAWEEREKREMALMPQIMEKMMVAIEPTMKSAMSELYAVYFDEQELADIGEFFDTPSGTAYARKSFTITADPRLVGAMMQAMPDIMSVVADLESAMEAATADLPAQRGFAELTAAEKKKLAWITGLDQVTLEESIGW